MKTLWLSVGLTILAAGAAPAGGAGDGLLPFDTRGQHAHFLTFRPGNGQRCGLNPPRLSWPYVPYVVIDRRRLQRHEFTLELSRTGDFRKPDLRVRTPYNFHNALPALDPGRWHWRVGWDAGTKAAQWSPVRSFEIAADAVAWDRTAIRGAAKRLAALGHPRLGPREGTGAAWRERLAAGGESGAWLKALLAAADRATRRPWWKRLPASDRTGKSTYDERGFTRMAREAATCCLAYRLTGEKRYAAAKQQALGLARYPKGGLSSPEYNGQARTKWPTQITEYLAVCYDLLHDELAPGERKALLGSIEWRLRAVYLEKRSWRSESGIQRSGVGCFAQSHPYENFMWSLPAVLLVVGDLPLADELLPLCLNYLTGVTSAHGPDEAWNEGLCYGTWKGNTMLQASVWTAALLPDLNLGRSPYYRRLGEWYAHLLPLGISRLAFGDYAATPDRALTPQRNAFRLLAYLTGDGRCETRRRALVAMRGDGPSGRAWLDLLCASRLRLPAPAPEAARAVFREAGWVMAGTRGPSDRAGFDQAVGMIFKCRPRGGYSHSFRSEGDFVWHAWGQTLSAGGGGTAYPDPHSRHTLSHNCVLIDGRGQQWDPWRPARSFCGRLLAWREGEGFVHWAGDATAAYQTVPGLLRWHRHVVFVDGRWFAILDDLAMRPEAKPARFSWLFHVQPDVPLTVEAGPVPSFTYRMGGVHARVAFGSPPGAVEIADQRGRDGFKNRITGEDLYDVTARRLASKNRRLDKDQWMAHNLWVTNRKPARRWTLLTALTAWRDGRPKPQVAFQQGRAVSVKYPGGKGRVVSFAREVRGDVTVDVERIRRHAAATDPDVLPPAGRVETVAIGPDRYRVEWLARERFDRPDWPCRWFVEGDSEVRAAAGKLHVRKLQPGANVATIWYRPELPRDVLVRFRAKAVAPADNNAANLNLFLHARERDGSPVRFGRSGQYKEYHEIPNYIVTFVGGFRPGWSRARRDPGFKLLHEAGVRSDVGKEYRIAVAVRSGRLRYYLDGRKIHDVTDPQPLPGGRFALRTWSTNAWWADVEIGRLLPAGD